MTEDKPKTAGKIESPDYRKKDLMKAGKIILYAIVSAAVVTAILYYLPFAQ